MAGQVDTPASSSLNRFIGDKLSVWQIATGLVTLVFAVERLATSLFYAQFGVAPEEVGIGVAQSLVEGAALLIMVFGALSLLSYIVLIPFWWVLISMFGYLTGWLSPGKGRPEHIKLRDAWRITPRLAIGLSAIVLALTLVATVWFAVQFSYRVQRGYEVALFPLVPWRVQRVDISWLGTSALPQGAETKGDCVMFLGQADDVTVLFNVTEVRTLRLPTSSLVLSAMPADDHIVHSCLPEDQAGG